MKSTAKKTDFHLVAIDNTQYWREDIQKACGGKIQTVYMYDKNVHTYCCEIVPSYYLIPLYAIAEAEIDDDTFTDLMTGICDEDPSYYHVSDIDKLQGIVKAPKGLDGIYYASQGRKYQELEEKAIEYLNCNHQI